MRLNTVNAAIGRIQLQTLDEKTFSKIEINYIKKNFADCESSFITEITNLNGNMNDMKTVENINFT